jgi:hypothetical protein
MWSNTYSVGWAMAATTPSKIMEKEKSSPFMSISQDRKIVESREILVVEM